MRTLLFLLITFIVSGNTYAQESVFKRSGDRKISSFKAVSKMDDASVIQAAVYFQNITKKNIVVNERNAMGGVLGKYAGAKSDGHSASAALTAYLVFSDGEPDDSEYQQAVDEFYTYLNQKLEQNAVKSIPWETFSSSKYFSQLTDDKEAEKEIEELNKKGNAWKIFTANKGPRIIRYNPMNHTYNAPAVKGTVRMANYGKEVKTSTLLALNIIIDFADIYLEGEAHSGKTNRSYSSVKWQNSTIKYDISPNVRITSRDNGGNQIFVFPTKSKSFDEIYSADDVRSALPLNGKLTQDASLIQKRSFFDYLPSKGTKHSIDPFVVEISKADYFNAVNDALKKYADSLAAAIKEVKK